MSKFVGKTLQSINSIFNNSGLLSSDSDKSPNKFISWYLDSESFVRKLKYAESIQSEEEIIRTYLAAIQSRLSEPNVLSAEIQEMIKICMIAEAKGYSTSFVYIHCLKLAQKGNFKEKYTGYLSSSYFLHPQHELVILLINTIQKDLTSSNYMEVLCALTCVCNLVNSENVYNVISLVEDKLKHDKASVRKASLLTLKHCLQLINTESAYKISFLKIEKCLSDHDLDVVSAAVCVLYNIIQKISGDFSYLTDSLLQLQEQILLRRVPKNMIYCDVPAPWLQLDILKFIKLLCNKSSDVDKTTLVLKKTVQQVGAQSAISHAIIYQAIDTIIALQPNKDMIETVVSAISIFLKSKHVNLKLTGIEALILTVEKLKLSISVAQQEIVMECLKYPDTSLQLKTLDLLYCLANPSNLLAVSKKFLEFLSNCSSDEKKKNLAVKIFKLCKKFVENKEWFVSTILSVLLQTENILPPAEIHALINLIIEDEALLKATKQSCLELVKTQSVPSSILKITASVVETTVEFEEILPILFPTCSDEDQSWFLVALSCVVLKTKDIPDTLVTYLKTLEVKDECVKENLKQLLFIIKDLPNLGEFEFNEQIDPSLSFLDEYVLESLQKGGPCYEPYSLRCTEPSNTTSDSTADSYVPKSDMESLFKGTTDIQSEKSATYSAFSSPSTSFQSLPCEKESTDFYIPKVKCVWTAEGRINTEDSTNVLEKENKDKKAKEIDEEFFSYYSTKIKFKIIDTYRLCFFSYLLSKTICSKMYLNLFVKLCLPLVFL